MVIRHRIRIADHFSSSLTISEYGDLGRSHSHRPIFTTLGEMTDADKILNPQHFGSDPADIRISIRVNPEVLIRNLDHFWLKLTPLHGGGLNTVVNVTNYYFILSRLPVRYCLDKLCLFVCLSVCLSVCWQYTENHYSYGHETFAADEFWRTRLNFGPSWAKVIKTTGSKSREGLMTPSSECQ